jgi:hypothetical protein
MISIPDIADMEYFARVNNESGKLIEQYGGQAIVDKHGTLCTTTTYQEWDSTCNFNMSQETQIPQNTEIIRNITSKLTDQEWKKYEKQSRMDLDSFKNLHKFDPEKYCNLFQEKIKEIDELGFEASQLVMDYKQAYESWKCNEEPK